MFSQSQRRLWKQPVKTRRNTTYRPPSAGKRTSESHDWQWPYFWLVEEAAWEFFTQLQKGQVFKTNNHNSKKIYVLRAKRGKTHVTKAWSAVGLLLIGTQRGVRIFSANHKMRKYSTKKKISLEENLRTGRQTRRNACEQITINCGFICDWLKK